MSLLWISLNSDHFLLSSSKWTRVVIALGHAFFLPNSFIEQLNQINLAPKLQFLYWTSH